jgi:hypothetical protein
MPQLQQGASLDEPIDNPGDARNSEQAACCSNGDFNDL